MDLYLKPSVEITLPEQGQWTLADWQKLPDDGFKYEVLDGVLYTSPPPTISHQNAISSLLMWMRRHAHKHDLGLVLTAPVGVRLPNQAVPVQPDILFVSKARHSIVGGDYINGAPDLVVEVLSPSNWLYDRGKKQELYRQAGVREYWIVDVRAKTVDVLVLEDGVYLLINQFGLNEEAHSRVLTDFVVPVAEIFWQ